MTRADALRFSTISKVEPLTGAYRMWLLSLSCGHATYEKQTTKPSIWQKPESLGRRRRKRCRDCEWESRPGRTVTT